MVSVPGIYLSHLSSDRGRNIQYSDHTYCDPNTYVYAEQCLGLSLNSDLSRTHTHAHLQKAKNIKGENIKLIWALSSGQLQG